MTAMTPYKSAALATMAGYRQLVDAEDYFRFFSLDFDPQVLNVNRLHILRHFSNQLSSQTPTSEVAETEAQCFERHRQALVEAYALFEHSSGVEQKLFAVFRQTPGHIVRLEDL